MFAFVFCLRAVNPAEIGNNTLVTLISTNCAYCLQVQVLLTEFSSDFDSRRGALEMQHNTRLPRLDCVTVNCDDFPGYCRTLNPSRYPSVFLYQAPHVYEYRGNVTALAVELWLVGMQRGVVFEASPAELERFVVQLKFSTYYFVTSPDKGKFEQNFSEFKGQVLVGWQRGGDRVTAVRGGITTEYSGGGIRSFVLQTKNPAIQLLKRDTFDAVRHERKVAIFAMVPELHNDELQKIRTALAASGDLGFNFFYADAQVEKTMQFLEQFGVDAKNLPSLVFVDFDNERHVLFKNAGAEDVVEAASAAISELSRQGPENGVSEVLQKVWEWVLEYNVELLVCLLVIVIMRTATKYCAKAQAKRLNGGKEANQKHIVQKEGEGEKKPDDEEKKQD